MITLFVSTMVISILSFTNYLQNEHARSEYEKEKREQEEVLEVLEEIDTSLEENSKETLEYFRGLFLNDEIVAKLSIPSILTTLLVKGKDNEFYQTHLLNRQENIVGTEFVDYRCNLKSSSHLTIYGKSKQGLELPFEKLKSYLDQGFGQAHQELFLETDQDVYRYEIFSVEVAKEQELETDPVSYQEVRVDDLIALFENNSSYFFPSSIQNTDQVLTLRITVEESEPFYLFLHAKRK